MAHRRDLEDSSSTEMGGLLLWNKSRVEEGGHLVMFTGQDHGEELQAIENAERMVSCGYVYATSRGAAAVAGV